MPEKINDHTQAEIAEAFARVSARSQPVIKACLWCGKESKMRASQLFCTPAHKAAYAREAARLQYEKLLRERQAWLVEREGYIKEIEDLRAQLKRQSP